MYPTFESLYKFSSIGVRLVGLALGYGYRVDFSVEIATRVRDIVGVMVKISTGVEIT